MGKIEMKKIRWHKRSETRSKEDITEQDAAISSLKENSEYQSFIYDKVQLFVIDSALSRLKSHLSQDTTKETGGILVGNVSVDSQKDIYYTKIIGAIAAPTTWKSINLSIYS
jgi:hypothetical protein